VTLARLCPLTQDAQPAHEGGEGAQLLARAPGVMVWMQITSVGVSFQLKSVFVLFRLTLLTFPIGSVLLRSSGMLSTIPFPSCEVLLGAIFILCSGS